MLRVLLALLLLVSPALAQTGSVKTQSQINSEINSLWPDNTTGLITPANARQTLLDIVSSAVGFTTGTTQWGLTSGLFLGTGDIFPGTDSTTALAIKNSAQSSSIMTWDTLNLRVGINRTPGAFALDVNGNTNITGTTAISGATTIGGNTNITGTAAISGALTGGSSATFTGAISASNCCSGAGNTLQIGASVIGVSLSVAGDIANPSISSPTTTYTVDRLQVSNCSGSTATVSLGAFTASGAGGAALASKQAIAITTTTVNTAGNGAALNGTNVWSNNANIFLNTSNTAAVTCNVYVWIRPIP